MEACRKDGVCDATVLQLADADIITIPDNRHIDFVVIITFCQLANTVGGYEMCSIRELMSISCLPALPHCKKIVTIGSIVG